MVLRVAILVALTATAVGVAYFLQKRRSEPPSSPSYRSIAEVDRSEFADPTAPVLVAMFGSTTCHTCPEVWAIISALEDPTIAKERIDVQADPSRHKRYRIDGVPTTIVANLDGTVRRTMFGPITAAELSLAIGEPG